MISSPIQLTIHDVGSASAAAPLDLAQLQGLFEVAAFWARDRRRTDLAVAIANSSPVVSAWQGDRLVGFARATSDGIYRATIWDVVVHPDCQSQGIGRKLVETVLSHPRVSGVERVYLMTTFKEKFYERVGFQRNASTTMVLHNQPLAAMGNAEEQQSQGLPPLDLDEAERDHSLPLAVPLPRG